MGLVVLLSASKTLRVARDRPHHYRTAGPGLLPRFGPAGRAGRGDNAMKAERQNKPEKTMRVGQMRAGATSGGNKLALPGGAPGAANAGRSARWWGEIASWFSPERWGLRRPQPVKQFGGKSLAPVQQELALGAIKPCRNDLSDAGWELAQARPASASRLVLPGRLKDSASAVLRGGPVAAPGPVGNRI
jgi:hypothetical protein